ncbi:MAG TPA: alpha/beta hydrolase [Povalibacter sp.]
MPIRSIAHLLLALFLMLPAMLTLAQNTSDDCTDRVDPAASPEQDRIAGLKYTCLRLDGRRVLVTEAGDAQHPPVLLVHGLGSNAHRDWRDTYPTLSRKFHVIALDLPGFGASDPVPGGYSFEQLDATIIYVARQLGLRRFHLAGHSLGAAVSLYFAAKHPELVDRLVLVDAAGVLLQQVFTRQLLEANRSTGSEALDGLIGVLGTKAETLVDLVEERLDISSWVVANGALADALLGTQMHADAALGLVKHDFTSALRSVRAPTVILWGSDDTITPLRTGELLAGRIAGARLQIIPGARHVPMLETPDEFNRLLLDALANALPPQPPVPTTPSQGDVECVDRQGAVYSGTFNRLSLSDCPDARIENAWVGELVVEDSNVTLKQVTVDSKDVALQVSNSTVTGTVVDLHGKVALHADSSRVDLAGAKLRAREKAVDLAGSSRIYFSVSEIDAPDYRGDAHFVWPPR